MKQTEVEWLEKKLIESGVNLLSEEFEFIEQAKVMEKEQSYKFWQGGINCTEEGGKSFEQYYNETYGK